MFYYILKKEFLLIFRNIHALLVLFLMPTAFIIIMSLALKNTYSNKLDTVFQTIIVSKHNNDNVQNLMHSLNKNKNYTASFSNNMDKERLLQDSNIHFIIVLPHTYLLDIQNNKNVQIDIYTKAKTSVQTIQLLKQELGSIISEQIIKNLLLQLDVNINNVKDFKQNISHHFVNKSTSSLTNSVQQSVPAWLIFSMFFILIPISNTFINERNLGTLNRIRTINVSLLPILFGKIFPYYCINLIQVLIMLLLGHYFMPFLGVEALIIRGNVFSLFVVASLVSLSAISFALIIANIANKSEEATTIGGISNIILAAMGGIMVPKFVMPQSMQNFSELSPMSWALESFLEIIVQGGTLFDVSEYILKLSLFAIICFIISYGLLKRKMH